MNATDLTRLTTGETLPYDPTAYAHDDGNTDPPVLDVNYDYESAARQLRDSEAIFASRRDVFRWLPLLPVERPGDVLPAGGTPLVSAPRLARRFGLGNLYLKDETRNPTRCLKDRATAVGITMAMAQGHTDVYCASAGNAAISLAGFAAHAGLTCHAFVPNIASRTRIGWLRRYGANIHISTGNYDQAYDESEEEGARHGWYSRNCALNPFLVEGKKTCAFEIADDLGGVAPDWVISASGDGCTLGAIGKGFREMVQVGLLDRLPRLVGVQSEEIQPMVRRFNGEPYSDNGGATEAQSIAVRKPRNAVRLLREIEASDGEMIAVPDTEIAAAQRQLATQAGLVAEFTSAATLAALARLAEERSLEDQTAVLVITGGRLDEDS
ncbi:MAG: pyridoxal-phosphate dependent enzyme [Thermomicrobiales bacterium]